MHNKAERNYCVTDKELLSLRYFIEYYRQYLLGRRFTVRTDHRALSFLFHSKNQEVDWQGTWKYFHRMISPWSTVRVQVMVMLTACLVV